MITKYARYIKIFILLTVLIYSGCRAEDPKNETEFIFGTTCSITLYAGYSNSAFQAVFSRVREIENKMSVNIPGSEVSEINNRAGIKQVTVSEETYLLFEKALRIAAETGGALDITVGPLVEEWGIGTEEAHVPSEETVDSILPAVNYQNVVLYPDEKAVFLREKGMKIDFGAIAKGYAADEAVKVLREREVKSGIIDFGGNILVFGSKKGGDRWRIGIQQPDNNRGKYFGIVEMSSGAVVSSGSYERYFTRDGVRYHHILDPGIGYPVRNSLDSVTVVTGSGSDADGYSTALFVMGLEEGYSFVERADNLDAVFVTKAKEVYVTGNLRQQYIQSDADYPVKPFEAGPRQR